MSGVTGDARKGKIDARFRSRCEARLDHGLQERSDAQFRPAHGQARRCDPRPRAQRTLLERWQSARGAGSKPGERPYVIIELTDAGGLFRFTDTYSHMIGGSMYIAMDPPTPEGTAQEGLLEVRDFYVRGDQGLDGVAGEFQWSAKRCPERDLVLGDEGALHQITWRHVDPRGPGDGRCSGATIDGVMNYAANELHLRGTFIPLYGLNSALGDVPLLSVCCSAARKA